VFLLPGQNIYLRTYKRNVRLEPYSTGKSLFECVFYELDGFIITANTMGYEYVPKSPTSPAALVVNEQQAAIVRSIFEMFEARAADDGGTIERLSHVEICQFAIQLRRLGVVAARSSPGTIARGIRWPLLLNSPGRSLRIRPRAKPVETASVNRSISASRYAFAISVARKAARTSRPQAALQAGLRPRRWIFSNVPADSGQSRRHSGKSWSSCTATA
jgi:hypothetical protein